MRFPSDVSKTRRALTLRRTLMALAGIAALGAVSTLTTEIANGFDTRTGSANAVQQIAGQTILAALGITDAMAGNGNGNGNGGYQAGCSDQNTSNNADSAHCSGGGGSSSGSTSGSTDSGSSGGTSDSGSTSDTSGSTGGGSGGSGGSGGAGAVASFKMCDGLHHGALGRLLEVYVDGRTAITNVRCD